MDTVLFKKRNHTAIVTFNHPETLNVLSENFMGQINQAIDFVEADENIYTLILTGTGKAFIAGSDIKEMYSKNSDSIFSWSGLGSKKQITHYKLRPLYR